MLDMNNAFNIVSRAAMLSAVKERAPAFLPVVQLAYGDASSLRVARTPEGAAPIQSQGGVRQGKPLAPLIFTLTLQPVLEHAEAGADVVPLVACLYDVTFAVSPAAGATTFKHLLDAAKDLPIIGLEQNLSNCGVNGGDAEEVVAVAKAPGIGHMHQRLMSVGTLLGTPAYIGSNCKLRRMAEEAQFLAYVDTQMSLPLSAQMTFLLLLL